MESKVIAKEEVNEVNAKEDFSTTALSYLREDKIMYENLTENSFQK